MRRERPGQVEGCRGERHLGRIRTLRPQQPHQVLQNFRCPGLLLSKNIAAIFNVEPTWARPHKLILDQTGSFPHFTTFE